MKSIHVWLTEGYICMCGWNTESKENTHSCSSRKEVLALYHSFQYHYCYSESDVMCHVTMYCSMIGPHYAVHEDTACVHYTLPFLTSVPSLQDCNRHSPSHCFVESFCPHLLSYSMFSPGDLVHMKLTLTTPMYSIAKMVAASNSGLEVKDRVWLKMTIPKSFIGKSNWHTTENSVLLLAVKPLSLTWRTACVA